MESATVFYPAKFISFISSEVDQIFTKIHLTNTYSMKKIHNEAKNKNEYNSLIVFCVFFLSVSVVHIVYFVVQAK